MNPCPPPSLSTCSALMALILELGGTSLMHKLGALAVYVLVLLLLFYRSTSLLFRPTTLSASQARELSKDRKVDWGMGHTKVTYCHYATDRQN